MNVLKRNLVTDHLHEDRNQNIISFNISEKTTVIVIAVKKDLNGHGIENLGASFFNFVKVRQKILSDSNYEFHIKNMYSPSLEHCV